MQYSHVPSKQVMLREYSLKVILLKPLGDLLGTFFKVSVFVFLTKTFGEPSENVPQRFSKDILCNPQRTIRERSLESQ